MNSTYPTYTLLHFQVCSQNCVYLSTWNCYTGCWSSTEIWNSAQLFLHGNYLFQWLLVTWYPQKHETATWLFLHGNYLFQWLPVTAYPQKHEIALSYCHMAITCYTGCWLLGIHRNMKQQLSYSCMEITCTSSCWSLGTTETWNSTQLFPHGNYLLYWLLVTGYPQTHETWTQVILLQMESGK